MYISKDLYRYGYSGTKGFMKAFFIPGFKYTLILRLIQKNTIFSFFFKILWRFYSRWYGIQIQYDTEIGAGFYIGHFGNIVVNGRVKIGRNFNISHGVTIGATNRGKNKGTPIIGDCVWVGTNAIIVGKIRIGNNVLIAPGAYINTDVPDNSICLGNPAKIITKDVDPTINYINNRI